MEAGKRSVMEYNNLKAGKPLKMNKVEFVDDEKVHHVGKLASSSSDEAMPLPLYFTNAVFFALFFSVVYFLLTSWREKIRTNTPLHIINLDEIVALLAFVASFIYLLGFFGIDFVRERIKIREQLSRKNKHEEQRERCDLGSKSEKNRSSLLDFFHK